MIRRNAVISMIVLPHINIQQLQFGRPTPRVGCYHGNRVQVVHEDEKFRSWESIYSWQLSFVPYCEFLAYIYPWRRWFDPMTSRGSEHKLSMILWNSPNHGTFQNVNKLSCSQSLKFGCHLSRFEQEHRNLSQVKVDEMLGLMCHVATEVPSHNAMPCWVVFLVELLLDVSCNVFLDVEFLHSLSCAFDGICLHLLAHISILHNCLAFRHLEWLVLDINLSKRGFSL